MIEPVMRRLDDRRAGRPEREERDDQLGDVAERRVEDAADLRARSGRPGARSRGPRHRPGRGSPSGADDEHDRARRRGARSRARSRRPPARASTMTASADERQRRRGRDAAGRVMDRQILAHSRDPTGRPARRRGRGAGSPSRRRRASRPSPRGTPSATEPLDLGPGRHQRVVRRGRAPRSGARSPLAPPDHDDAPRPRAGIAPSAACAASSPSDPRTICSWSLVSSRQTAAAPVGAAGRGEVAQRRREPRRRLEQDASPARRRRSRASRSRRSRPVRGRNPSNAQRGPAMPDAATRGEHRRCARDRHDRAALRRPGGDQALARVATRPACRRR